MQGTKGHGKEAAEQETRPGEQRERGPASDRPQVSLQPIRQWRQQRLDLVGTTYTGEAEDVDTAVEAVLRLRPDVVLLDVHLPGGGGGEVMRRVGLSVRTATPGSPETRFLALSVSDAAEDVIAIIRSGARGYVTKTISGAELADAVRRVAEGDAVFSPRLAGFVLDAFASAGLGPAEVDPELDQLTAREREVLRHIARGYMYKEIAQRLGISAKTVEAHVSAVLRKLQLSSRHELSRWAADRRMLE